MSYHYMTPTYSTLIESRHWPTAYAKQFELVSNKGGTRKPRGFNTLELRPVMVRTLDTSARFLVVPGRGINHCFSIAETVSILAGFNSVDYLAFYNENIRKFSADGKCFEGHYGERISQGNQLDFIVETLTKDRDSRRAMLSIWNPDHDAKHGRIDYPCNVVAMYKVENLDLESTVIRRSSDLIWGVPSDHVVFTVIQDIIARSIGAKTGSITEFVDSLHLYKNLYDDALNATQRAVDSQSMWAVSNGRPSIGLVQTRVVLDLIVQADMRMREQPPTMFSCARDLQEKVLAFDGWWSDAAMTLMCYHLWKAKQWDAFLRAAGYVGLGFKSALLSTFENRVEKVGKDFESAFANIAGRYPVEDVIKIDTLQGESE